VSKREPWENLLAETKKQLGGVNFVINNAGATYKNKPVLDTTEKDFDLCFDVNMKSVFHSVHVMIPALRETRKNGGPAAIVNVASTAGIMGRPGLTWYAASKAACISCTKNLAIEFGPEQIRFNAICPVFGNTGLKHMFMGETTEDMFLKSIPLGRCSEPEGECGGRPGKRGGVEKRRSSGRP
jgi:NAD(P)-dependent dehydrogenase (short-subunit alcohol dehydrogenase family)